VAIYLFGWDQQRRETMLNELKTYAKAHGYTIVRIYIDSTRACPKLRRLLGDAKKGSFEIVLVRWVLNLGNRSRLGGLRRARELDGVGVRVESVGEPWFDVHLPALEWIFEDDHRRHEKSKKAREAKRAAGQPAGPIEYGYAVDDHGNVVPRTSSE
jgi:DNA invertase Pin-like site-specific DNA recombinase